MFDFAGSEIAVIGIVALVLIGPRDMPVAIRAIARTLKKMRHVAGEFQRHVDQMVREADMGDVPSTFRDLGSMNLKHVIADAVDHDGSVTRAFDEPALGRSPPAVPEAAARRPSAMIAPSDGPVPALVPPVVVQSTFAPGGR